MRSILILLVFLGCIRSYAQTISVSHDSSAKPIGHFRFRLWNEGLHVNGANFYLGYRYDYNSPRKFLVNGLDFALAGFEYKVNGLAFALVYSEVRKINGLSICPFFTDQNTVNGIGISGLIAIYSDTIRGMTLTGLGATGNYGSGVCISGLWNTFDDKFSGLVFSGLYNHMWSTVHGVGITAGVNQLENSSKGIIVSGVGSILNGTTKGVALGGLFNLHTEDAFGLSLSLGVNRVKGTCEGMQISAFNRSSVLKGTQIGVINSANRLQGIQLGLINVNRANPKWCRVMPIINFSFKKLDETDTVWGSEAGTYVVKSYHDNGILASIKQFKNNLPHGMQSYFTQYGDLWLEVPYVNGKKNGVEKRLLGGYEVAEEIEYRNDSVIAGIDRLQCETVADLELITRTTASGKNYSLLAHAVDTLLSYSDGQAQVVLTDVDFHGTLISVAKDHRLEQLIWVSENDLGHTDTIQLIYPFSSDTIDVNLGESDGNQTHDFVKVLDEILAMEAQYVTLIVHSTFQPEGTTHSLFVRDSSDSFKFRLQSVEMDSYKHRSDFIVNATHAVEFYSSGAVKRAIKYPSDTFPNYKRIDYFENGNVAYYASYDTVIVYADSGIIVRFDTKSSATTYNRNGIVGYYVTPDTLRYYGMLGYISVEGIRDTIWRCDKYGRPWRRIEIRGDSVLQIDLDKGSTDSSWYDFTNYFYSGPGFKVREIISKEPVIYSQALMGYEDSEQYYLQPAGEWFGMKIVMKAGDGEDYWMYRDLSPVRYSPTLDQYRRQIK